jgi:hypothetical protein
MLKSGSSSWRLTEDIGSDLHYALFVREAYRLAVPYDRSIPPPLAERTPDLSGRLGEAERSAASSAWPQWWAAVAGLDGRRQESQHLATLISRGVAVDDPPQEILDTFAVLRRAAVDCQDEARSFAKHVKRRIIEAKRNPDLRLSQQDIDDVLDRLSSRSGRPRNSFAADTLVVDVEGPWWTLTASGTVIRSLSASQHHQTAQDLLEAAFH